MRELVLSRIREYLDIYGMVEQYAILNVLNLQQSDELLEYEDLLALISTGSDEEVLSIYDIFSTSTSEMGLTYGVPDRLLNDSQMSPEDAYKELSKMVDSLGA